MRVKTELTHISAYFTPSSHDSLRELRNDRYLLLAERYVHTVLNLEFTCCAGVLDF